jgi:hypothetical protein
MSMVAGIDADCRARLNGRTDFVDPAGLVDAAGLVGPADADAGAAGAVAVRFARLALPIG